MNGIESQYEGTIDIIRLNLLSPVGRKAAAAFGIRIVPATLLLDETGTAVSRHVGVPDLAWITKGLQNFVEPS